MADNGGLKLVGVPEFKDEFQAIAISDEIEEEMTAINAIYGDHTWEIETAFTSDTGQPKIRTCLRLPGRHVSGGSDSDAAEDGGMSLKILLPGAYPQVQPEFQDVARWNKLDTRSRNICIIYLLAVHAVFTPGAVCMYDVMEHAAERVAFLDGGGALDAASLWLTPETKEQLEWTRWAGLDACDSTRWVECTICRDDCLALRMVHLPCGCYYCPGCLKS